jgi:hypothetical protein
MASRRPRGVLDREAELEALSARLAACEAQIACGARDSDAGRLARSRMAVLLRVLEIASRRWAMIPLATDPAPNPIVDERLRRLAVARLDNERDVARAAHLLSILAAFESEDGAATSR